MDKHIAEVAGKLMAGAKANIERDGSLEPVFFVANSEGVGVVPGMFDTPEEKAATIAAVRMIAKTIGAEWVMSIAEAWQTKFETAESVPEGYRPSQDERRVEVVFFSLHTPQHKWIATSEIVVSVTADGQMRRSFSIPEWTEADEAEGQMTDLLSA